MTQSQPISNLVLIDIAVVALNSHNAIEIAQYVEQQFEREIHIGTIDHVLSVKYTEQYEREQQKIYTNSYYRLSGVSDF